MTSLETISRTRPAGLLCAAGGILGAVGGLVTAFLPTSVSADRFAYPYSPAGFIVAELSFAISHVLVLVGVLAVYRLGLLGRGRTGRIGTWVAAAGWLGLTLCEFAAMTFWNSAYPTPQTGWLDAGYGISTILIGVGMTVMGVAALRAGVWTGWRRFITIACGAFVFVAILPAVFSGGFTLGRLVLVAWMLMLAALGTALATTNR